MKLVGAVAVADPGVWSVGHSTHRIETFVSLLQRYRVEVVADVRTSPFSRFNPQFNRNALQAKLEVEDIGYLFLGEELGGRPPESEFYDADGHVRYGRMAESLRFESGLVRVIEQAKRSRVGIMCSEEDPAQCHRFLLVTRVLRDREVEVTHIRGNGDSQVTAEIGAALGWSDPVFEEESLLDGSFRSSWRSTRPVLRRQRS